MIRTIKANAISDGACGLTWIAATNTKGDKESFWGFAHLGQVVRHLGLPKLQSAHL